MTALTAWDTPHTTSYQLHNPDLVVLPPVAVAIDCGRPADYPAANLFASGGRNVIGDGASVLGRLTRSVIWDGAWVGPDEVLSDAIQAGDRRHPVPVPAGPGGHPR